MTINTARQMEAKLPAFREFLTARGAQLLVPTNEWEVVRFKAGGLVSVIYKNARGLITAAGPARAALDAFTYQGKWDAGVKGVRKNRNRSVEVSTLLERDGETCFLCRLPLGSDITVEHLVPVAQGGPNHIANKALAHQACNLRMGHLSVMEKIALREKGTQ